MAITPGRIFAINLLANSKPAEDAFKKVGQAAGRIPTPMKVAAAALTAVFAAVSAVAIKSFRELLDLGEEFNNVTRTIRVGTGAVGGDLAALEQSFRNVASAVPSSFGDIATVVAELDTRTDLAGEGLEDMATQLLTLSRLMGGDAQQTTRAVTRLFNRFGLEAEGSSKMLDLLFRASQASGASIDRLAEDVTKNAGALGGMGLSLEESIALFALFEREGIRSETVVRAIRSAFVELTKDGRPLQEGLADIFDELQNLDREAAVARGLEVFGSQALELVDAVRDGRLSIEDFTKQIVEGEDSIIGVAEETDGWRVKLDELRNFLKLQFEDTARAVFEEVTGFVDELRPAAERVAEAFEEDGLQGALRQLADEWDKIYTERIQPLFERFLVFLDEVVKPLALEVGQTIGAAIASGMWSAFKSGVSNLFGPKLGERVLGDLDADSFRVAPSPLRGSIGARIQQLSRAITPSDTRGTPFGGGSPVGSGVGATGGTIIPFAAGGLVTSPVLGLVGEAGPEVVIPLDRFDEQYGGGTLVVNVTGGMMDPEGVAREVVKVLNESARRGTGGAGRFV